MDIPLYKSSAAPVSYTHLDVYKRQEICSAKNLVGVIFGPTGVGLLPGECGKVDIECLEVLDRRGVTCAIMTDGPIMNPELLVGQALSLIHI